MKQQNKVKRETKTKYLVARATPSYKERVDKEAARQDISVSDLIKTGLNTILPNKEN